MEKHPSGWSKGAFFICEKCGRREDGDSNLKGFADAAKGEFKSRLRELGKGKEIRVMVSGCLSLCPKDQQAAAWCPTEGKTEILAFDASEKEAIFNWLKSK